MVQARTNRGAGALESLRALIIRGRISPGSRLSENEVAARLGVSRTPAREALKRLQAEGFLLQTNQGRRIELAVRPLTTGDLSDAYLVMAALEGAAARTVAAMPDAGRTALARTLEDATRRFQAAAEQDPRPFEKMFDLHNAFHALIAVRATGPRLRSLIDQIRPHVERYEWIYAPFVGPEKYGETFEEHAAMVRAIAEGNADAAERATRRNWRNSAARLLRAVEGAGQRGDWIVEQLRC
jgi:DNA-binding GntR family transcriptional regulator